MNANLLAVVIAVSATTGLADSYRCVLSEVTTLTTKGTWEDHPLKGAMIAQQIVVNRGTGRIFHLYFGNESYPNLLLFDRGSPHSSFKAVAYSEAGVASAQDQTEFRNSTVFQIMSYVEGLEKPFVAMTSSSMGVGLCR